MRVAVEGIGAGQKERLRCSSGREDDLQAAADCGALASPVGLKLTLSAVDPKRPSVVVLSWQCPAGIPADASIAIQRATDSNFTLNLKTFAAGPGPTTFADATCEPMTTYWYRVRFESAAGASPWTESLSAITVGSASP